ncbi:MAG: aromatic amino acid DMT transporter YddG [Burkholderiaceae bacterium]|nr:aromatic amino acid DMT transporter YddG [Burkholderiaceae bacterium]
MALSQNQATLVGCIAPLCWGLSVSIVRILSETVGVAPGLALKYILAFVILFLVFRFPNFRRMPLKYYICGFGSALACSVSFAFSLAMAQNGTQTMEVGMVNYLWPSLTILFAVMFNKQKARWWIILGILLAFYGILMIISKEIVINFSQINDHVRSNPVCYLLALISAVAWASYSNFTTAWAQGENPTTAIFALEALFFTGLWLIGDVESVNFSVKGVAVIVIAAVVMGGACVLWNYGVQKGKIAVLGIASFFTPVLSSLFAFIFIGAQLTSVFWLGVAIVVLGSFICWKSIEHTKSR